jgi:hypothetical protein
MKNLNGTDRAEINRITKKDNMEIDFKGSRMKWYWLDETGS